MFRRSRSRTQNRAHPRAGRKPLVKSSYGRRLRAEQLEDRRLLAGVTVGNALDVVNAPDMTTIAALVADDGGDGISLREAITAANNDATDTSDTIDFDTAGVFSTAQTITLGPALSITDSLSINGQGVVTISGGGNSRVFHIDDGDSNNLLDVTLNDLTVSHGSAFGSGTAGGSGGGILARENLSINRSTISGNESNGDGAGIWMQAGAFKYATLTVTDSTISGNTGSSGGQRGGGGICVYYTNVEITGSTISGNSTSFSSNSGGGGVYLGAGTHLISNSTISGNEAKAFHSGIAGGGGGIFTRGYLTIRHSTIAGNRATSSLGTSQGGGIRGGATLENTIVAGNTAEDGGNDIQDGVTSSYSLIEDTAGATITDNGGTITGVPANLGPLQDNGGTTQTHALLAGSPTINAGDPSAMPGVGNTPEFDQRGSGFDRVLGFRLDIGAVEMAASPPSPLEVSSTDDAVDGQYGAGQLSLREAILWANETPGSDTITFSSLFDTAQVIALGSELPTITDDLTITGPGANLLSLDAGGGADGTVGNGDGYRHFDIQTAASTIDVQISGMTLTGGDSATTGGAISNTEHLTLTGVDISGNATLQIAGAVNNFNGTLEIDSSTFAHNSAGNGSGAIYNQGSTTIVNSTFSQNSSSTFGGAIGNAGGLSIDSSTFFANSAPSGGGTIAQSLGSVSLNGSILAGSSAPEEVLVTGGSVSGSFNLIEDGSGGLADTITGDPMLGFLSDNGGPTLTHGLTSSSSARDAGDPAAVAGENGVPEFDQRGAGFSRVQDGRIDIGAFEGFVEPFSFHVTTAADVVDNSDFLTSLREAILYANALSGADTITFDSGMFGTAQTIGISSQLPTITDDVTIAGPGADLLTIDAGGGTDGTVGNGDGYRIFKLDNSQSESPINVEINGLTLTGGDVVGHGGAIDIQLENLTIDGVVVLDNAAQQNGGGINNFRGNLSASNSTFQANSAGSRGGGIFARGGMALTNVTISGNSADIGGGIDILSNVTISNSTIIGNSAASSGGGLNIPLGTTNLTNSIVAGSVSGGDIVVNATLVGGFNLIEDGSGGLSDTITGDPMLGTLQNNGGPTPTHALTAGSPAIDAGDPAAIAGQNSVPEYDQRGGEFSRVRGLYIDIGAYEDQANAAPVFTSSATANAAENTTSVHTLTVQDDPTQPTDFRLLGQAPAGELGPDRTLEIDETISSPDGMDTLVMQNDGNLVVYTNGVPTWASGTAGSSAIRALMQLDGNLVMTTASDSVVYATGSSGNSGGFTRLRVTNGGVPEIVRVDGEVLWRGTFSTFNGTGTVFTPAPLDPAFVKAADTDLFQISGSDELQFIAAPDFEIPTDSNSDNVYEVSVLADDGNGGVTPQTILVTVTNVVEPGDADFDNDGDVDGADFLAWQRGFGTPGAMKADGDADNDLDVDGDDLAIWQNQFGQPAPLLAALGDSENGPLDAPLHAVAMEEVADGSSMTATDVSDGDLSNVAQAWQHQHGHASKGHVAHVHEAVFAELFADAPTNRDWYSPTSSSSVEDVERSESVHFEADADLPWLADELLEKVFG